MEVRHDYSSGVARGLYKASQLRGSCEEDEGWPAGAAASDAGGHLRWGNPHRGGEDWRRDTADHPGLGDAVLMRGGLPACLMANRQVNPRGSMMCNARRLCGWSQESGPIPAIHGVVRWRLIDLAQWIYEEFRITVAKQTLSRELRAMGYRKLSARPRHHAQAEGAIEDFKKLPSARLDKVAREKAIDVGTIEIWFQDEARIGQKNKITRRWAKRGISARARLGISEPHRPISSVPSARNRARARL